MHRFGDRCPYAVFTKSGNPGKSGLEGRESSFIQPSLLLSVHPPPAASTHAQDTAAAAGTGTMNSDSWNEGAASFFLTSQLGVNSTGLLGQLPGVEDTGLFSALASLGHVAVRGPQETDFEMEISMPDPHLWKRAHAGWSRGRSWL